MAKREWKQDAERNAGKSWKETITSYYFPYFALMTDWGLLVVMGRKRKGASHRPHHRGRRKDHQPRQLSVGQELYRHDEGGGLGRQGEDRLPALRGV